MWRPMTSRDINKVYTISLAQWGSDYYESLDVFRNKLEYYPDGCFVYEEDFKVHGYLISHPWSSTNIPEINEHLTKMILDTYYIHDIVLLPEFRGENIAAKMIHNILKDRNSVCLVAPEPTQHYWKNCFGFEKTGIKCKLGVHMKKISIPTIL
jgi:ribosomal protein S18 acetylase RimI-like enzyme